MEELSLHLLDIAENSLRAGAQNLVIIIKDNPLKNYLFMSIKDDGRGMDSDEINRLVDPFYTTRTERNVGLGIPLLKMTAESCNGSLLISSALTKGTTIEIVLEHDHIDRPPLGDITATIITLLVGWPTVNLHYKHYYQTEESLQKKEILNPKCFIFDTEEIRERLDNLPINNNKVISFLRQYIKDNLIKLYGGEINEILG